MADLKKTPKRVPKVAKRPKPVLRKPAAPLSPAQKLSAKKAAAAKAAAAKALLLKKRKGLDTTAVSLLPKAAEKGKEILYEKIINLPQSLGGYRMLVLIPKGCDGGVDMYFPGGASGIDLALKRDDLRGKWIAAGKKGKRRALVILEGKVTSRYGYKQKYAYMKEKILNPQSKKIETAIEVILRTINGKNTGKSINNVHVIGHSMGGQGIHHAVSQPGVTGATCLDSTYWSHKPIVDLAERGGRVNVVFIPGTRTESVAKKIISKLGLTKKALNQQDLSTKTSGKWESKDGKVKVYATRMSHGGLVNPFVGMFMGASSAPVHTFSPFMDRYAARGGYGEMTIEKYEKVQKDNPAGLLHKKYLDRVKKITASIAAADVKKLRTSSITDVRYNTRLLKVKTGVEKDKDQVENVKIETQRRLKAYTSAYDGKWYTLDYAKMGNDAKNRSHEDYVGLGDIIIDPSITDIIIDRGGKYILAKRGVVQHGKHKGRVGFIDTNGYYAYSNTGDKLRILTKSELPEKQMLTKYKEEIALRDKHEQSWKSEDVTSRGGITATITDDHGSLATLSPNIHTKKRPADAAKVDKILMKMIIEENRKLHAKNKAGYVTPGECEGYVSKLSEMLLERMTGKKFDLTWVRNHPLFKEATSKHRGIHLRDLKDSNFADHGDPLNSGNIPVGALIFMDITKPELLDYMKGHKKTERAPCYAGKRHWVKYIGKENGRAKFVHNEKKAGGISDLAGLKKWGNRRVYNIIDPYALVRGRISVDSGTKYLKAKPIKKKIIYASRGPGLSHYADRPKDAPVIDDALSKMILDEHRKLYGIGKHAVPGQCEGMAIMVAAKVKSLITGNKSKWKSLRYDGLFKMSTSEYRGKLVNNLKISDFAKPGEAFNSKKIPIGTAIYVATVSPQLASTAAYKDGTRIAKVVKATNRHWITFSGWRTNKKTRRLEPVFTDNHGVRTLAKFKRSVGNRKIINLHDPYYSLRGRMNIDTGGGLRERYIAPVDPLFAVKGPKSKFFNWTNKKWKQVQSAKFVDTGEKINSRDRFVACSDSFENRVILRKGAMDAFYRARQLGESGKYMNPPGPKVRFRVIDSYRSFARQRRYNPSKTGNKKVAGWGKSWHGAGAAIDVVAMVYNERTKKWEGGKWHKNQIYLKKIMPLAGMANYPVEPWHWEYGSRRWMKKTGRRVTTYKKVATVRSSSRYNPNQASA